MPAQERGLLGRLHLQEALFGPILGNHLPKSLATPGFWGGGSPEWGREGPPGEATSPAFPLPGEAAVHPLRRWLLLKRLLSPWGEPPDNEVAKPSEPVAKHSDVVRATGAASGAGVEAVVTLESGARHS